MVDAFFEGRRFDCMFKASRFKRSAVLKALSEWDVY